jgi:STE24 endopeptidase
MKTNAYFWLILASVIGWHLLDLAASVLSLRSLRRQSPAQFAAIFDEADYKRLLDYTATNTWFGIVHSTFGLAVLLAFWFCGGFGWLAGVVDALDVNPIVSGLVYLGALGLGGAVLALPFDAYDTFVIEQRFGFNRTTLATYIADKIKGLVLGAILGGALAAAVLALFEYGGPFGWLFGWIAVTLLMLIFVYIAPRVILPLFNKFTPLEEGELKRAILDYAKAQNFPIGGLFVMDGSRRSTKANAFFTGFGKTKKIALFDTLIAKHTVSELVAVLAHEIGHFKRRHIAKRLAAGVASMGLFLYLASVFIQSPGLYEAFGVQGMTVYCGLALFGIFYGPLGRALAVLSYCQSRKHEFEADHFAVETTGQPQPMIDALKKLARENLTNLAPHPLEVALHHSHPPVLKRIEVLNSASV